jgi:hypothetical protein
MAWTRTLALGLLFGSIGLGASACVVSVDDDPNDNVGGDGGTAGVSGSAGSNNGGSGNGGRSGSGGSTSAGTGGSAGDGAGGTDTFPAPTCDQEEGDEMDECAQCLKQNCCTQWLDCDDENCATELDDVSECVQAIDFANTDDLGMCISMSSTEDNGLVQQNTQALIECAIEYADDAGVELRCSTACFGSDIVAE